MSFVNYTNLLKRYFKRVQTYAEEKKNKTSQLEYMEMIVISQLPEKIRKRRQRKALTVDSEVAWQNFVKDVYIEILEEGDKGNVNILTLGPEDSTQVNSVGPHASSQEAPKVRREAGTPSASGGNTTTTTPTSRKPPDGRGRRPGPNYFERREGKCGRCLSKGHYRYECRSSQPKCSYCKDPHEHFECPRKYQKPVKRPHFR